MDEKRIFINGINEQAYNYKKWDWVLDQLGLQPSKIITEQELDAISVHVGGGEGKEHKAIKDYVYKHPECLGITGVIRKHKEHPLPSGDRLLYNRNVWCILYRQVYPQLRYGFADEIRQLLKEEIE